MQPTWPLNSRSWGLLWWRHTTSTRRGWTAPFVISPKRSQEPTLAFFLRGPWSTGRWAELPGPTDAKLTTASAIDFEIVRLDLVHRTMERESNTNILIMDAC